jgi:hypothetical protein
MKGCPEKGEQSFLFALYNQLSSGSCACPGCGEQIPRNLTDFFLLPVSMSKSNSYTHIYSLFIRSASILTSHT